MVFTKQTDDSNTQLIIFPEIKDVETKKRTLQEIIRRNIERLTYTYNLIDNEYKFERSLLLDYEASEKKSIIQTIRFKYEKQEKILTEKVNNKLNPLHKKIELLALKLNELK